MSTTALHRVAVTPGGDITSDMLAGWYIIYSIPEQPLSLARVRKAFRDNGLDDSRLPQGRRPEHVMQEACTKAQRISQNGHREEVRAQQVGRNEDFLIYQMTRHVHDMKERVIEHPKALRVLFDFGKDSLSFEPLDGARMDEVQSLADEIQDHFDKSQSKLPGRGLRTIIRHYIEAAGGEWLRDGAYFLTKTTPLSVGNKLRPHHGEAIDGETFISQLKGALIDIYDAPEFHDIPCVNDEGQRAYLKRKFLENCAEDLKAYRDECLKLAGGMTKSGEQRTRRVREDKRTGMVERRKEIDLRRQKFAELLGEQLDELGRDMQLADKALAKFLQEAD